MNYRHIYHAGNFADVFKHAVLSMLVERFKRKDKAFCVLDTHAGIGWYNLDSVEAAKTAEADRGIRSVVERGDWPPALWAYKEIIDRGRASDGYLQHYPGSPALILALMRSQDRLVAVERHSADHATLRRIVGGDPRAAVHLRDGYEAVRGLLPPTIRRGLVLIDPPYERTDEDAAAARAVVEAATRWPTGQVALWYPIKAVGLRHRLVGELRANGLDNGLVVELEVSSPRYDNRLVGSGMLVVRPPFGFADDVAAVLQWLLVALGEGAGRHTVMPISQE